MIFEQFETIIVHFLPYWHEFMRDSFDNFLSDNPTQERTQRTKREMCRFFEQIKQSSILLFSFVRLELLVNHSLVGILVFSEELVK